MRFSKILCMIIALVLAPAALAFASPAVAISDDVIKNFGMSRTSSIDAPTTGVVVDQTQTTDQQYAARTSSREDYNLELMWKEGSDFGATVNDGDRLLWRAPMLTLSYLDANIGDRAASTDFG